MDSGKGQLVNLVPMDLVLDHIILGYLRAKRFDADQIEFCSLFVTALCPVIEPPPALDRTHACDRSHMFEGSLLE
jgi:hypothetical protein